MAGIVFLRTTNLVDIVEFYTKRIGMKVWIEQPDVTILQHDNLLLGFHQHKVGDVDSLITIFYDLRDEVDQKYQEFEDIALGPPKVREKYQIYNFFAKDPEGRTLEIQKFLHDIPDY